MPVREPAEHAREPREEQAHGEQRGAREGGAVALREDQHLRHEEEGRAERAVEQQRDPVRAAEAARAEEREGQHRLAGAGLPQHEPREERRARERGGDREGRPARLARADQAEGERAQPERHEDRAGHVHAARARLAGLRDAGEQPRHDERERHVDQEHQPPRRGVHERAAHDGPEDRHEARRARPQAHGASAPLAREDRADDGEAARHEQRAAHALHRARRDERREVRRETARHGRRREHQHPQAEHAPASVAVAERAAHEDERREQKRIGVHDPLHARDVRVQVTLQGGKRDVHDRPVDEGHAGAQDGRPERPLFVRGPARLRARRAHAPTLSAARGENWKVGTEAVARPTIGQPRVVLRRASPGVRSPRAERPGLPRCLLMTLR